jgi:hypothetical protein
MGPGHWRQLVQVGFDQAFPSKHRTAGHTSDTVGVVARAVSGSTWSRSGADVVRFSQNRSRSRDSGSSPMIHPACWWRATVKADLASDCRGCSTRPSLEEVYAWSHVASLYARQTYHHMPLPRCHSAFFVEAYALAVSRHHQTQSSANCRNCVLTADEHIAVAGGAGREFAPRSRRHCGGVRRVRV